MFKRIKANLKGGGMNISIKGKTVRVDDRYLHVELEDGRIISTPIAWYKELQSATLLDENNQMDRTAILFLRQFLFLHIKKLD